MSNAIGSIIRQATRKPDEPLNILTFPSHERYESQLVKTGHNFYAYRGQGIKDWNPIYAPVPKNYTLLNPEEGDNQLPPDVEFDLVLSQNKFGQFQKAWQLSKQLHLPLISLEHTLPLPQWRQSQVDQIGGMAGEINVFISEYSRDKWGWKNKESVVVHHGIDTNTFSPLTMPFEQRKLHCLSVVNEWITRNHCCGYDIWVNVTKGLPVKVLGDTPGLSVPAKDIAELSQAYREARVFLNTSTVSPVPTALLEAMASGCSVVTTSNCMLPEIIENGVNGFISNDEGELRNYCQLLLKDTNLAARMGAAARQTILTKFSESEFIRKWNEVFDAATHFIFTK